ncbi:MAG: sugar ABC transporter permease [Spirochaetales bacterium]|nr:sugar ABC transporter permease [Spirochaetales bacterium]
MSLKVGFNQRTALWFHLPAMIMLTLVTMIPLIYNIRISFFGFSLSDPGSRDLFVGFQNYIELFTDTEYWNSMWVTTRFVISSTFLQLVLGIIMALLIHYYCGRLHRLMTSLVMIPMMVAPLVVGLMYSFIMNPQFGLYSFLVDAFHLNLSKTPLSSGGSALFVLILTDVWEWTPFMALMTLASLKAAPIEPYEAALIDGAGKLQIFMKITVPLIRPVVVVSIILRGIEAFKVFDKPFILTGGGPGNSTEVIDIFTYREAFVNYNFSYAAALCVVLFVMLLIAGLLYWKFIISRHEND